jgi:hypothetical protein
MRNAILAELWRLEFSRPISLQAWCASLSSIYLRSMFLPLVLRCPREDERYSIKERVPF